MSNRELCFPQPFPRLLYPVDIDIQPRGAAPEITATAKTPNYGWLPDMRRTFTPDRQCHGLLLRKHWLLTQPTFPGTDLHRRR